MPELKMSQDPSNTQVQIDLNAYLTRIGYDGPDETPPTLETLGTIQRAHVCTIPFENIDAILNQPIKLDPQSVQRKLITLGRGGYCFEHNGLLIDALTQLGFEVESQSARVRFSATRDFIPPRTHLFAKVTIDRVPWCVDVGVGGLSPTAPFRMDIKDPQRSPHDTRRVILDDASGNWFHQVQIGEHWNDVCEFTGESMPMIDREVANWWTSTHPDSKFRKSIMAALADPDGSRHTLGNRHYAHRRDGKVIDEQHIESTTQLLEVLATKFNIHLPSDTVFGIDGL
tara:strand:+ start:234 stop:1088 length:855 start_codon:yes stop_codon:yes gene_type:complete